MKAIAVLLLLLGATLGLAATSALYLDWPSVDFEEIGRLFAGSIAFGVPALLVLRPSIVAHLHGLSNAARILLALLSFLLALPAIYLALAEVFAALVPEDGLLFAMLVLPLVGPVALVGASLVSVSAWVWSGASSETPRSGKFE